MQRLRSRWTVVALVPAFFLAGFGLVFALADDGGPETEAATGPAGAPSVTTVPPDDAPTQDEPSTETDGDGGTGQATSTAAGGGSPPSAGGGRAPPPPPSGSVTVDYGNWDELFAVENTELVPEIGSMTVTGEFRYLGGSECPIGNVTVRGWYFDVNGERIGNGIWESMYATGPGAEVPQREPLYLEVTGTATGPVDAVALRITEVTCL